MNKAFGGNPSSPPCDTRVLAFGLCMNFRDPIDAELPYRPELALDQHSMLIEWAVARKHGGRVRARGTDPQFPGSTFWELDAGVRITLWPSKARVWATTERRDDSDAARILQYVSQVLATHPPTRH